MQNQPTILQKIVQDKAVWVDNKQKTFPLSQFQQQIVTADRDFYAALAAASHQVPAYILECKKASPSKGLIRAEFDLDAIAQVYKHYASVISVLTDEQYFQGDFRYIEQVKRQTMQPILCKDFMISPYQVYLARYSNADAILLMLSVLDDETYRTLADLAHSLGMGVLTETSTEQEFERALALGAKVIGVNNRDLHTLTVDMNRIVRLVEKYQDQIPADVRLISESGIYDHSQVKAIKPFAHAFLIGSSLMGSADLNNAVRSVIFGENKVCGLTRPQDVKAVYENGFLYGGLIFAENSPRQLSLRQAQELVVNAPLRYVGVFQNQAVEFVEKIAKQLELYAVQLHGTEDEAYITKLSEKLAGKTQIWQAISVDVQAETVEYHDNPLVARYILDSKHGAQQGGTGRVFDWQIISSELKPKALLAGGISAENIEQALVQGCLGVDLNSGVEQHKGVKDLAKMTACAEKILKA
ncbi:bifunctional indole-3-glycerol-phosphate synthase TrpC/phosphoribosylanthranilate isomerase TrpF [Actinobacillus pleuropneumoniae]|uniref:Multifunctional fusion protein n=1 Tax=Actinobacillus pleuropneumoniae serotype 7 (strain AP76) TaxID=537457 RepID=B3H1J8_ACTP7|nr:bifunctional indole-3-glycerol-phosphate synthase TrpC/phosphoribosylanthranilate isomerase TrpF [Actinobacillus pleuropneumoniae]ACE61570.1 tryptophan biosynthesis protein trpCF [Actinobacillus pleuropneumoniae serovar 7 str. AP76]EFN02896.1 Indole-3-glycerol-phosphate synthase [Actinobacillus pleuropneumoniae serovar 13 str. N273]MCL7724526.1 bifunctional indole-3-glycerol-phosphate synthase TrpC/phosphoribosylanthranilate isomerase TrpF [Actinobacillus pleuropneumoniae]MCL7737042.1 bifunc